jgi:hypothetical protein
MSNLHKEFAKFNLSDEEKMLCNAGISHLGSLNRTKVLTFAKDKKITNSDIDWYMAQKPSRGTKEKFEDYKARMIFSKFLLKFRAFLYNYSKPQVAF